MMFDPKLLKKYSQDQIDEAIKLLSYHNAPELPKEESDIHPTIYIFRHGQSVDNADFIFSGWRDSELTEKGKDQALELADKLATKKIDSLYSSPQIRAIQTLKLALSKNDSAK